MRSKVNTIRMIGCMAAPLAAVVAATLAAVPATQAATITYTSVAAGGDWQTNSTWTGTTGGTTYPGYSEAGDDVSIANGATVTLSGTIPNSIYNLNIGSGTLDQTGGSLTTVSGSALRGGNGAATSTYEISGGTATLGGYYLGGANGVFTLDVGGGTGVATVNLSNTSYVAQYYGGTINVKSGGVLNSTSTFDLAEGAGNGVLSLDGGTFQTDGISAGSGPGTSTVNFNGGTLQATTNITISGLTSANVQNGGAVFDTNGHTVTVSQNLISDPTSPGGGLTLKDSSAGHNGTLILSNTGNTYNGNTTVDAGTLQIDSAFLASTSTVSIASGALMNLNYSGTDTVDALYLNGVAQANGVYGASSLGSSYFSGTGTLTVDGVLVPEPTTLALYGLGMAGLLLVGRRRQAR